MIRILCGERGGSVVECRTPEREVRGSRPTSAVLCPWARHFTPRKYWLITQEAMAPSQHNWKIVDWDVKPQHNQPTAFCVSHIRWKTDDGYFNAPLRCYVSVHLQNSLDTSPSWLAAMANEPYYFILCACVDTLSFSNIFLCFSQKYFKVTVHTKYIT